MVSLQNKDTIDVGIEALDHDSEDLKLRTAEQTCEKLYFEQEVLQNQNQQLMEEIELLRARLEDLELQPEISVSPHTLSKEPELCIEVPELPTPKAHTKISFEKDPPLTVGD